MPEGVKADVQAGEGVASALSTKEISASVRTWCMNFSAWPTSDKPCDTLTPHRHEGWVRC